MYIAGIFSYADLRINLSNFAQLKRASQISPTVASGYVRSIVYDYDNYKDKVELLIKSALVDEAAGDFEEAIYKLKDALRYLKTKDNLLEAKIYYELGTNYYQLENYKKAFDCHKKALEIRKRILGPDSKVVAESYDMLGDVYRAVGENRKALSYFKEAYEIRREKGDPLAEATSAFNIGTAYRKLRRYELALQWHEKALDIREDYYTGYRNTPKELMESQLAVEELNELGYD